jgi:hypothetical protein
MRSRRRKAFPAAVLIRAIQPLEGVDVMMERVRGGIHLGPGKLTQALGITKSQNYADLTESASSLRIEAGFKVPDKSVTIGPRVGLNTTPEPWFSKPWRFLVKEDDSSNSIIGYPNRIFEEMNMGLLEGKNALIFGLANDKSIAWGITQAFQARGREHRHQLCGRDARTPREAAGRTSGLQMGRRM